MKYRWDKKYLYWGVTAFCVVACSLLFYYGIFHISVIKRNIGKMITILMPVIYGLVIGYLLSPVVNFFESRWFYPLFFERMKVQESVKNKKRIRSLSILFAVSLMLFVIFGLFFLLIPQLTKSISNIVVSFPFYYNNFTGWIADLLENNPRLEIAATSKLNGWQNNIQNFLNNILPSVNEVLVNLSSGLLSIFNLLKNFFIGIIISIYVLNSKELFGAQSKKLMYSLFTPHRANKIINNIRFTNEMFSGFIVGKIVDSAIIGVICFFVTNIIGTPYAILVSVIIGVTNIIPFFGPYLGAVPCALLILLVNPIQCIYFIIFIIILQTFDGNILGPKILGESTGLSSFWVIFAILLFGGLFGIIGMFIGVPVFAVIYTGIRYVVNTLLMRKNLSTNTSDYMELDNIDETTNDRIYLTKDIPEKEKNKHFRIKNENKISKDKSEKSENKKDEENK